MHYSEYDEGRDEKRPIARTKEGLKRETSTLGDTILDTFARVYKNECMRSTIMTVADPAWYRLKLCFCNDVEDRSFHFCCHDQLIFHPMHFLLSLWQCLMFSTPFNLKVGGWPCADNCRANGDEVSPVHQWEMHMENQLFATKVECRPNFSKNTNSGVTKLERPESLWRASLIVITYSLHLDGSPHCFCLEILVMYKAGTRKLRESHKLILYGVV